MAQYLDDDGNPITASPDVKLPPGYSLLSSKSSKKTDSPKKNVKELKSQAEAMKPAPIDYTSNPKNEGLYEMFGRTGAGDAIGSISVPYSKVKSYLASGGTFAGDTGSGERYDKDKAAEGKPVSWYQNIIQSPALVSTPNENPQAGSFSNLDKAAARMVLATPAYAKQLWDAAQSMHRGEVSGGEEFANLINPYQVPIQMYDQFKEDVKKDPKMAVDNFLGSLFGLGAVGAVTHGAAKAVGGGVNALRDKFTPVTEAPARERTNVIHRNQAGEVRQAPGQAPTVWLSPEGWGHFVNALAPGENPNATHGVNIPANEHLQAFIADPHLVQQNPAFADIQKLLSEAHSSANQGGIAIAKQRPSIQQNVNVMREELNHTWQRSLANGDIVQHLSPEAFADLNDSIPRGMRNHLMFNGYDDLSHPVMVSEAAAKLMDGRPERFDVTPDEAVDFLDNYFKQVSAQHGTKALEALQHVRGIAADAKARAIGEHGSTGTGQDSGVVPSVGGGGQGGTAQSVPAPGADQVTPYAYKPIDTTNAVSGTFYHGTKAPISSVSELDPGSHGNEQALYGIGAYLTDNPEVAKGYAKTKGKVPEGKVLPANIDNAKLLNLEQPVPAAAHSIFEKMLQGITGEKESLPTTMSGKQLFGRLQEAMEDEGWPRSEAQDTLGELTSELRQQGYHGLWHEGGGKVGTGPHNVAIIFPDYGVGRPLSDIVRDSTPQVTPPSASLDALFNREKEKPTWYLKSERLIGDKMKGPQAAEDVHKMLISGGVKPEEMQWTGLDDFLTSKGKDKVTPEEVRQHLAENNIQIHEVTKGGSKPVEWKSFKTPKGDVWHTPEGYNIEPLPSNGMFRLSTPAGMSEAFKTLDEAKAQVDRYRANSRQDTVPTKYGQYQLPGGENYREMLLTAPSLGESSESKALTSFRERMDGKYDGSPYGKLSPEEQTELTRLTAANDAARPAENYQSNHWEEPNILAHVRFNDRTGPNGEKLLHVEEVQSDWHQNGRDKGYANNQEEVAKAKKAYDDAVAAKESAREEYRKANSAVMKAYFDKSPDHAELSEAAQDASNKVNEARARVREAGDVLDRSKSGDGVPDAPFKKTWHEMALRRMLKYASENGYDGVSWTPGEDQNKRYSLSHQVDKIAVPMVKEDGSRSVRIDPKGGGNNAFKMMVAPDGTVDGSYNASQFTGKKLDEVVGKDMAQKIMEAKEPIDFEGKGLEVGGSGMKGFYDKIVPDYLNKFGKKWGAKVGETKIGVEQYSEPFDPSKAKVLERAPGVFQVWAENSSGVRQVRGGNFDTREEAEGYAKSGGAKTVQYLPITPEMRKSVAEEGVPLFNREQVKTPEFKKWFGDSKAVDDKGEPKVVYHGTSLSFNSFEPNRTGTRHASDSGDFGKAAYFADDPKTAEKYAYSSAIGQKFKYSGPSASIDDLKKLANDHQTNASTTMTSIDVANEMLKGKSFAEAMDAVGSMGLAEHFGGKFDKVGEDRRASMMPVYLKAEKPLVLGKGALPWTELWKLASGKENPDGSEWFNLSPDEQAKRIQDAGYDSVHDLDYGQWAVFEPTQIKSAIGNSGAFDPKDPNILRNRENPKDTPSPSWSSPKTISREDAIKLLRDANEKGKNKDSDFQDDFKYLREGNYVKVSAPLSDLEYIEQNPDREQFYAAVPGKFPPVYGSFGKNSLRTHLEEGTAPQVAISNGNHRSRAAELRGDKSIDVLMSEADYDRYVSAKKEHDNPSAEQDSPTDLDANTNTKGEDGTETKPEQAGTGTTGSTPTAVLPIQGGTVIASPPIQNIPVARTHTTVHHHTTANVSVPLETALGVTPVVTKRVLPLSQVTAMAAALNPSQPQVKSVRELMKEAAKRNPTKMIP
jgi:hypothetical protein